MREEKRMSEREMPGLSQREAESRLLQYGENRLKQKGRPPALAVFAGQFRDAMVMILLLATAVSAMLGEVGEAAAIFAIVVINALIGFFQEIRTEKTLETLARLAAPAARVRRGGQDEWIDAAHVVPGDLLVVEAGDRIAADGVILSCTAFSCDESLLTGESVPEQKHPDTGDANDLAEAHAAMAFMGTNAVSGKAVIRVTATGMKTEMGGIAGMLGEIKEEETPLQRKLDQVGRAIGLICLAVCALVAAAGLLRGEKLLAMLLTGISLAVAAVPEGLPAIVTVSLALAVRRILKRNALVKRLHAVETLGCTTVICTDKTGTLTENRMTAQKAALWEGILSAGALAEKKGVQARRLLECAAWCGDAKVRRTRGNFLKKEKKEAIGDPTEAALALLAADASIDAEAFHRESEEPFDSVKKRMSVTGFCPDGKRRTYLKGAPEILLPLCGQVMTAGGEVILTKEKTRRILSQNDALAKEALRVLGFAYKEEKGELVFLGLIGLSDPPRKEAYAALAACRGAGVRVVMITGDQEETARAVGEQLCILRPGEGVVTGRELDGMEEETFRSVCKNAHAFARVTPEHKLRIVHALREMGEIVAMTGDGVNDAPALKEADIGVAMGNTGTDVTREAAQIILLDDNFATLVAAVEEGRIVYQNIRRFLRYLLSCNTGEVLTMFGGMLLGMPVVLTPIQLLLVNLVTDGLPAIALGMEPGEEGVMKRPPRDPKESVFSGGLPGTIALRGALIGGMTLLVFSLLMRQSSSLETARTGALVTLVTTQLFHALECRSEREGLFGESLLQNPFLTLSVALSALCVAAAVYLSAAQEIFGTRALTGAQLRLSLLSAAIVPVCAGISGLFARRGRVPVQRKNSRPRRLLE